MCRNCDLSNDYQTFGTKTRYLTNRYEATIIKEVYINRKYQNKIEASSSERTLIFIGNDSFN